MRIGKILIKMRKASEEKLERVNKTWKGCLQDKMKEVSNEWKKVVQDRDKR